MSEDWYVQQGRKRWAELDATRAQAQADLQNARASGYDENAAEYIQTIADCNAAQNNLRALLDEYLARSYPPTPSEPSREELMARPMDRMSHADMYRLLKGNTKHGIDDAGYMAGIREVAARRARGVIAQCIAIAHSISRKLCAR